MTTPVFVDTNVLLYAIDQANNRKHAAARKWRAGLWQSQRGRLSFQVLQEFYANVDRRSPQAIEQAQAEIRDLLAWHPTAINAEILELGWRIQSRYKISFWDALIVASAKAASCRFLLTEDLQADQDFGGLTIVNPFKHDPTEFLAG
jgi:predicted nucleic acid-binding protein